jgi:hypothetical protein
MSYLPSGFTPDEEKEVLTATRAAGPKLDVITESIRKQDQLRMIITVGSIAGFIFTLTRFGDLVAEMRRRRREQ